MLTKCSVSRIRKRFVPVLPAVTVVAPPSDSFNVSVLRRYFSFGLGFDLVDLERGFFTAALYEDWNVRGQRRVRRVDHAGVFPSRFPMPSCSWIEGADSERRVGYHGKMPMQVREDS